jgi:hypothetical protein
MGTTSHSPAKQKHRREIRGKRHQSLHDFTILTQNSPDRFGPSCSTINCMSELEKQLEAELLALYEKWKPPSRNVFLRMVKKTKDQRLYKGPVGTVRYLLNGPPSVGFIDLVDAGKTDLTVEALIIQPKWSSLFTEAELEKARTRLREARRPE